MVRLHVVVRISDAALPWDAPDLPATQSGRWRAAAKRQGLGPSGSIGRPRGQVECDSSNRIPPPRRSEGPGARRNAWRDSEGWRAAVNRRAPYRRFRIPARRRKETRVLSRQCW
jgi:hypothetical protein